MTKAHTSSRRNGTVPLTQDWFVVHRSRLHGLGGFARRNIPAGTCIIEYTGERITDAESDRRYDDTGASFAHTFLFILGNNRNIDANVKGNEARFINHSCDPNCESDVRRGHVYITALRDIRRGEELTYDYYLTRTCRWKPEFEQQYACHCGGAHCRRVLLYRPRAPWLRKKKKA